MATPKNEKTFEESYGEVEGIVKELESGNLDLASLWEKYEKAVSSLKNCYEILHKTEKKIEVLKKGFAEEFSTEPFVEGGEK